MTTPDPQRPVDPSGQRLDSWKEIAAYLARDVRTVQRWERREGLPVHRLHHTTRGSVYASADELDAWRRKRDIDARPQPPGGVGAGLRPVATVAGIVVIALAAAAVVTLAPRLRDREPSASPVRALAVLPLVDLSGRADNQYFADGMTEALIGRLSTLRDVRVISRTSVMAFKGARPSPSAIARSLNVDAVVEGTVTQSADRVRIAVRLVSGRTEQNLWSRAYERELRDVLTLQSDVAEAIAREMTADFPHDRGHRTSVRRGIDPETYATYLKARFHLARRNRSPADVTVSVRLFEEAMARDRTFAPAHAGAAAAYQALGTTTTGVLPVIETIPKSIAAARRALELDDRLGEAHVILAQSEQQAWNWEAAETGYRRAIALDANDAEALAHYGMFLITQGRASEGVPLVQRARELDPLTPGRTVRFAWALYHARQFESAVRELRTVLAVEPDHLGALWFLGFALTDMSKADEAIDVLEHAAAISDRRPSVLGALARAYGRAGRHADARRLVDDLVQRGRHGYVPPAAFVHAYLGADDPGRALASLERSFREHSNIVQFLKTHPAYDPLRGDPRFIEVSRKAGLF